MKTNQELKILSQELFELEKRGECREALNKLHEVWDPNRDELKLGDVELESEFLLRYGSIVGFHGHANQIAGSQEKSKDLLTEARSRFLEAGNLTRVAECENYLALCYQRTGEFSEAMSWCDEARSHNLDEFEFSSLYSIVVKSLIFLTAGKHEEAIAFCSENESVVSASDDDFIAGCFNGNFAAALKGVGRTIEAIDKFESSRTFHQRSAHLNYLGTVENSLALSYIAEGRFAEALRAVNNAIDVFEILGDKARKGAALDTKAQLHFEEGKYPEGLETIDEAIEILKSGENTAYLTEAHFTKAKLLVFLDELAAASGSLYDAMELARTNVGVEAGERLAKEFEIVVRKKSLPQDLETQMRNKIYEGDMELILPPSLSNYDNYQVIRIRNSHLEQIGIYKDSLAVVVEDTIKRGDLVAITEIAEDAVVCGFYDYFAGIVSITGMTSETLLFKTEEVKVVGKIIGVGDSEPGEDGMIHVRPVEI